MLLRLALIGGSAGVNVAWNHDVRLTAVLGLASMAVTAELAVRPYSRRILDRILLMAGSLVAAFVILGLALNITPWGMTSRTWNAAWAVLGVVVIIARRGIRTRLALPGRPSAVLSLSMTLAAVIFAGAGWLAMAGVAKSDREPVLALSVVGHDRVSMTIEVDAISTAGSYRITALPEGQRKASYTSAPFSIATGQKGKIVRDRVPVNVQGPWVVDLYAANGGKLLRELIVNIT